MYDPDFGEIVEKTAGDGVSGLNPWKVILGILLFPVLAFVALNLVIAALITIKPFTERDRLVRPVTVKNVTDTEIVLVDGRRVSLPFIKRIPKDDPVFREALEQGVEVDGRGEAYGLITVYPSCGMTAYRYVMRRINLSDLAGALSLDAISDPAIPRDEIQLLKESVSAPVVRPGRVVDHFLSDIHRVRRLREQYTVRQGDPGLPATGEPFHNHDNREDGRRPDSGPAADPAPGFAQPERGAEAVPEVKPKGSDRQTESDQGPSRCSVADQIAGIPDPLERADPQIEAVGDQAEAREELEQEREGKTCALGDSQRDQRKD